ncbi:MAG: hypothetical protein ACREKL_02550 [Chthoniobacterales bacterium]
MSYRNGVALIAIIWAICITNGNTAPIGFEEEEGFQAGSFPMGVAEWSVDAGCRIVSGVSSAGSQHLEIGGGEGQANAVRTIAKTEWGTEPIAYYDFWVRPTVDGSSEVPISIVADGASMAFVKDADRGVVAAYSATPDGKGKSMFSGSGFAIDDNEAQEWHRLTIREDYARRTWDIYLDGVLTFVNLGMDGNAKQPSLFAVTLSVGQKIALDSWQITKQQPLFADSDNDGMPDDWEKANELDPLLADRDLDADGDGVSNIEEFLLGRSASQRGVGQSHYLYVDNRTGDDNNTGALPYAAGTSGPKFSIKTAMAEAKSGDVIVVLKGTGFYNEGSRSAHGKALTIKTTGGVTIK